MPIDKPPGAGVATARLFGSLTVLSIGAAATLATILGFLGSLWWLFDIMAGYRLQLAVVLLLVASAFRIGFGLATGALFVAAGIVNLVIVAPLFPPFGSNDEALEGEGTLTIASVPVEETGKQESLDWVEDSGVDVAFLLDTDATWEGLSPPSGSAYIIVDQVFLGRQTGVTVVARRGIPVTVTGIASTSEPVVRAETEMGESPVVLYAMFVSTPTSAAEATQRDNLLKDVATRIREETAPVAVIGDLGVSQWSHGFRVLANHADLTDSSPGNGFQASTPGGLWIGLRVPTQHLLFTDALTELERHLGPDLESGRRILQGTIAFAG